MAKIRPNGKNSPKWQKFAQMAKTRPNGKISPKWQNFALSGHPVLDLQGEEDDVDDDVSEADEDRALPQREAVAAPVVREQGLRIHCAKGLERTLIFRKFSFLQK
jgi:hypothetical protein